MEEEEKVQEEEEETVEEERQEEEAGTRHSNVLLQVIALVTTSSHPYPHSAVNSLVGESAKEHSIFMIQPFRELWLQTHETFVEHFRSNPQVRHNWLPDVSEQLNCETFPNIGMICWRKGLCWPVCWVFRCMEEAVAIGTGRLDGHDATERAGDTLGQLKAWSGFHLLSRRWGDPMTNGLMVERSEWLNFQEE